MGIGTKKQPVEPLTDAKTKKNAGDSDAVVVTGTLERSVLSQIPLFNKLPKHLRGIALLCFGLIVLTAGLLIWNLSSGNSSKLMKTELPAEIDTHYDTTPTANFEKLLAYDYDLTLSDVKHGNLRRELDSFQEAYDVAIVLHRLNNNQRAIEAYKVADQRAPDTVSYDFYKEFCGIAYQAKNIGLGDEMCDKAKELIQASQLEASDKDLLLKSLKSGQDSARSGASQ